MQKISTRVFIYSSVVFGIIGIIMILTGGLNNGEMPNHIKLLQKMLFITVCVILPSFALSVASKYLK